MACVPVPETQKICSLARTQECTEPKFFIPPVTHSLDFEVELYQPLSSSTSLYSPTPSHFRIMGKGKNHDKKANPGFGKQKLKGSAPKGEFTLKRVKGEVSPI